MNADFQAGLTCSGSPVSVMGVPSESLDGAPYAVWALEGTWLVSIGAEVFQLLWMLESHLPPSDVQRIISLWAISLAEDMEIVDDQNSW